MLVTPERLSFPGLEMQAVSEAAAGARAGGDFCDMFPLGGGKVALVLGDVCGHGLPAARHVPDIKLALRAILSQTPSPGRALAGLNDCLCRGQAAGESTTDLLATATVIVLHGRTGLGACAVAGAETPLLLRRSASPICLGGPGMTLGATTGQTFEDRAFKLGPDDLLLLTTDGITEARREGRFLELAGAARLATEARWTVGGPAVCRAVLEGARRFAGGILSDDASVLTVLRRVPGHAGP